MKAALTAHEKIGLSCIRAGLEALSSIDLHGLSESAVIELSRELEAVARRVPSVVASVDQHLADRGVRASLGHISDVGLLRSLHRLSRRDATARARVAELVCERHTITGETLPAVLPATASVFSSGQVSSAHVLVIADVLDALPDRVRAAHTPVIDAVLAEHAVTLDPLDLKKLGQRITAHLHPDGDEPTDELRQHRRTGWLKVRADGSGELWANLSASDVALWQAILTPLMKSGSEATPASFENDDPAPPPPPCPDERNPGTRFADAFEQAAKRLLASRALPSTAGVPTTLVININLTDLERRIGQATTFHGGRLTIAEALRLAVDSEVIPVILGDAGEVLAYGRGKRLATPNMRRALFARDIGCTFPGCSKPAAESEIHHAHEWVRDRGATNIDNLTVACGFHQNEAIRQQWQTVMVNGRAFWRPPAYVDPSRTLRRNTYWDPPRRN